MATAMEEHVKETLKCKVCYETLTDPRTLPCMHTYCCKCLDKLEKKKRGWELTLYCPECRQVHTIVPTGGVAKFKVNFTTSSIVDLLQSMDVIGEKPQCTPCKESDHIEIDAKSKCIQCNKLFCKDCDRYHTKFHVGHTVLDVTADKTQDKQNILKAVQQRVVYCDTHKTNPLETYCQVDQCALCATCYVINHSGHKCVDIYKAAKDNIKLIDELLTKGSKLIASYEQSIQNIHTKKNKIEQEADDVTNELNNDMNTAIQAIWKKYTMEINLVAEKRAICDKQAEAHLAHLQMQKAITESAMSQLFALKQHGNDTQLANIAQDIISKSKEWSNPKDSDFDNNITFKIQRGEVLDDKIVFGKVDINILRAMNRKIPKPTIVRKVRQNAQIWDIAVTSKNEAISTCSGGLAKVYNKDLTLKGTFGVGFYNVTTKGNEIYLTSGTDTVSIYNQECMHSRKIKTPTLKSYTEIAVNSRGELVTYDRSTKAVCHVESATGRILTKSQSFSEPVYLAVNSHDVVIVSYMLENCVVGLTRDGKELFRYGPCENGQNQLNCPKGLCTDTANNIIVADFFNNRVHLLSPDGKFIRFLLTGSDGLYLPTCLVTDNDGHLLVGDSNSYIWVVKYTD
ncbi:unnamed protein product [Owenia fusiformis]|uniref:Uncharacterized protein n=1 Tax=Owenia fusiformis TaxID=6347 RepID=A0A8J1XUQ5_OWEFU|nr:unnamed protein product [Owenia fusiformis]